MPNEDIEKISPVSRAEWRSWLEAHHHKATSVWLIYFKKQTGLSSLEYSEAVDEALCFGWIDSTRKTLDEERFMQYFCRRKANSTWSKVNKEKVKRLAKEGLMTAAGKKSIQVAKQNGSWTVLDEVEALVIPADLEQKMKGRPGAKAFFLGLSRYAQKICLYRLMAAKRPETREKRLNELVEQLAAKQKPSGI